MLSGGICPFECERLENGLREHFFQLYTKISISFFEDDNEKICSHSSFSKKKQIYGLWSSQEPPASVGVELIILNWCKI